MADLADEQDRLPKMGSLSLLGCFAKNLLQQHHLADGGEVAGFKTIEIDTSG